jgi:hypothetical protein
MSKWLFVLIVSLIPAFTFAASANTGFVRDTVWFSDASLEEGDNTHIYSILWNGEKSEVSFKISLVDNGVVLQSKEIDIAPAKSGTVDFDFKASNGKHKFVAVIDSAKMKGEDLTLGSTKTNAVNLNIGVTSDDDNSQSPSQLFDTLNFKEGSPEEKAKTSVMNFLDRVEDWRKDEDVKINNSIEKIEKDRQENDSSKPAVQGLAFLHLIGVKIAHFIFSIQVLFYTVALALVYWVLKIIFSILGGIFRRRA